MTGTETIQTAHIKKRPSVKHDLAPSTAADKKETVEIDQDGIDDLSDVAEDEIPLSIIRNPPRRPQMPPLPDLRTIPLLEILGDSTMSISDTTAYMLTWNQDSNRAILLASKTRRTGGS